MEMELKKIVLSLLIVSICHRCRLIEASMIKVASDLNEMFEEDEEATSNIFVEFDETADDVLDMINMAEVRTMEDRISLHEKYVFELQLMSRETQEPLVEFLNGQPNENKCFWITNQIFIRDASKKLIESISKFENVAAIRKEKMYHILKPTTKGKVVHGREGSKNVLKETDDSVKNVEWNIAKIHADQVWGKLVESRASSTSSKVCTVGVIDTGVMDNHEAFEKGMVIAWKDAINGKKEPYDDNGHGTHVTGTIAGINGIGVAPGVKTVHCKACDGGGACPENALTDCAQFMTEKRPNVVSNSWGGPAGSAEYEPVISGWKALNIFSVFAAGNEGPSCKTVGSPADYGTVGVSVGATTSSDGLANFSSRGQSADGHVVPTVSAPGQEILSAWPESKSSYKKLSGTSMATPHVAGLYAILYNANNAITFEQAQKAIVHSCQTRGLEDPHQTCGGTSYSQTPNNLYGNGRIDCTKALQTLFKVNSFGKFMI